MSDASSLERFLTLAKRELKADAVVLFGMGEAPPETPDAIACRLPDGRHVVATFLGPPDNREALERRLSMLASTFADAIGPASASMRPRPPVASTLHEELKALAQRGGAVDAVVIDVDSPVVWGSAAVRARPRAEAEIHLREVSSPEVSVAEFPQPHDASPQTAPDESTHRLMDEAFEAEDEAREPLATRAAISAIRRLPTLDDLHKGGHLRHVSTEGARYLVMSFSGIYLLCMVFAEAFDELRAERAAHEALARIERLVLALPPLDPAPPPMGDVIALRARSPRKR